MRWARHPARDRAVRHRPGQRGLFGEEPDRVPINPLYLAKTERVEANGKHQVDANTPEGEALWGPDLTGGAIGVGKTEPITVASPGRWDARAVDRDGREQLITGLHLDAGGKYILELYEGNWRVYSP